MSAEATLIDTMLPWTMPVSLLAIHFVADFMLQTDKMALNKSKWNQTVEGAKALMSHCAVYSACFLPFGWKFAIATFMAHLLTDGITSKLTTRLWLDGQRHWFFTVIGADQLIHAVTLAATYAWLIGG